MPTKTFYLNEDQTAVLTAKWGLFHRNFEAFYNGQSLGEALSADDLRQGYRYNLPDGRVFTAQLIRNQGVQEMQLLLDEQPLPGSSTHPYERVKQAWYVLLFIGLLSTVLGITAEAVSSEVLRNLGLGWPSAVEGLMFLGLGWWGYQRRSSLAFYLALSLLVLDKLLTIGIAVSEGGKGFGGFGSIVLWFFFCVAIFRGAKGAKELREQERQARAEALPIF